VTAARYRRSVSRVEFAVGARRTPSMFIDPMNTVFWSITQCLGVQTCGGTAEWMKSGRAFARASAALRTARSELGSATR